MYLENVLPTAQGYKSVCYKGESLSCKPVDKIKACEVVQSESYDYCRLNKGTVASVNGKEFLFDGESKTLYKIEDCVPLEVNTGCVKPKELVGISTLGNRLILYSKDKIFWSSVAIGGELDFKPSLPTGAGSTKQNLLKGDIVTLKTLGDSLVVYTTRGALNMVKSQDQLKYAFNPLLGISGIKKPQHVTNGTSHDRHYVFTTTGLQVVQGRREVAHLDPQTSEFLLGNIIERYTGEQKGNSSVDKVTPSNCNEGWSSETQPKCIPESVVCTQLQESVTQGESLEVSLSFVHGKLYVSYGDSKDCSKEFSLVWDEALERWGKLKVDHVGVIDYKGKTVFIKVDGTELSYNLNHQKSVACNDRDSLACEGVIILGRYQLERGSVSQIQGLEVERVLPQSDFSLFWMHSLDGANWDKDEELTPSVQVDSLRRYNIRRTGMSHAVKMVGTFDLNTLLIELNTNGRR